MENQIDSFIEYLFIVEESNESLTQDQIAKLEMIKDKVTELVNKVESISVNQPAPQQIMEPVLAENRVARFAEYQELNEKVLKRGSKWVVTDKSGKKVLGTHPSREKAIKQLQAIEISKAGR
jgi:hypothetical protein